MNKQMAKSKRVQLGELTEATTPMAKRYNAIVRYISKKRLWDIVVDSGVVNDTAKEIQYDEENDRIVLHWAEENYCHIITDVKQLVIDRKYRMLELRVDA